MRFAESPEHTAIRAEASAWLEEHFPRWKAEAGDVDGRAIEELRAWQRILAESAWGAPAWPVEYGGRGFGVVESAIWQEEKAKVGANIPFNVPGFGMAGPTIISHGTDDQKERFLPSLLAGEHIWCQLFSEPGAGSDLASLSTRAVQEDDEWVVTGQKVWSSGAADAEWGILLARHDFEAPKHKGLIYLLVDMHSDGVDVRPLKQMDGGAHFSEVFLTDVRVPAENVLGSPGEGWAVAMTTLMNERMSLGSATGGYAYPFDQLVNMGHLQYPEGIPKVQRDRLVQVFIANQLLELLNARILSKLNRGQIPDAEGSVLKLVLAKLVSDSAETGVHLIGPRGGLIEDAGVQHAFLGSRAFHIGGGTDEIQRNVIAERVLGLPREPRPDKDRPFRETLAGK
ncbi:MAG TPA: acyl-CoA dehydrogenase family protein [Actinomycetota bacterium]|nr:acyl-CoA dehydrogenase family protein [Actinomycetota bacterium]